MIQEKKILNYVLYAIGEIALVVVGILIAVQIDEWNQNQQNRKQEQQILTQLLKEYQNNLLQIESKIYIREEVIKSSFALLNYREKPLDQIVPDSFNLHISRAVTRPTFDPLTGVTDELNNSGKLYLLTNPDLRAEITSFKSFLGELHEEEVVIVNHSENLLQPFLIQHYQLGRIISEFIDDESFRANFTMGAVDSYTSIKEMFRQPDIRPLLSHPDFEDHLIFMISNTMYTNQQSVGVKEKIQLIISLIEAEIK